MAKKKKNKVAANNIVAYNRNTTPTEGALAVAHLVFIFELSQQEVIDALEYLANCGCTHN